MNSLPNHESGERGGSLKSYGTGLFLALVLSAVSFSLVMTGTLSRLATTIGIFGAAVAQIFVHLYFFLHLDRSPSSRWNVFALLFTLLIMALFVGGSLWVMYNLNARMM